MHYEMSDTPASDSLSRLATDRRFKTIDELTAAMSAELARRRFHEIVERLVVQLRQDGPLPEASTE